MNKPWRDLIRPLNDEEYASLKASISEHGQFVAIVRDQDGVTIDGHSRERALTELGVPVSAWKVEVRVFANDDERITFAVETNLKRRQTTAEERKTVATRLYTEHNWTQEKIAKIVSVTQKTVSGYLEGIYTGGINSPPRVEKRGRPKKPPRPHKYSKEIESKAAKLVLDTHKGVEKVAAELGVSAQVVIRAKERETGRREVLGDPEIDRVLLSMTAQEKLDAAIRQYKKKLDLEFEDRVRAERLKREDIWLEHELKAFKEAEVIRRNHRGVMTKPQFRDLQRCLDTTALRGIAKQGVVDEVTLKRFDHVAGLIISLEPALVKAESKAPPLPEWSELMKRREEVSAKHRANAAKGAATRKANAAKQSVQG